MKRTLKDIREKKGVRVVLRRRERGLRGKERGERSRREKEE